MKSLTAGATEAINAQLVAHSNLRYVINRAEQKGEHRGASLTDEMMNVWRTDEALLKHAVPFYWSTEAIDAVMQVMPSIPLDTPFNQWNMERPSAWWLFEKALPVQTTTTHRAVDALCLGQAKFRGGRNSLTWVCAAWIEDEHFGWMGTQMQSWNNGLTLGESIDYCRREHQRLYNPGGPWHHRKKSGQILDEEVFVANVEFLGRFILAGLAWINQKVVTTDVQHVERHRRKEYERKLGRTPELRLVQLRKTATREHTDDDATTKREYHCQWTVDGHWRNQHVGVGRTETRLTWVSPYIKGPDDMPLKEKTKKVFVVNR